MSAVRRPVAVDIVKLRDYCLSEAHPRGRHKARVFRARLGLTVGDAEALRDALISAAMADPARLQPTLSDQFGQRYILDFEMQTPVGTATIRSAWIVPAGQDMLRMTTCYVL